MWLYLLLTFLQCACLHAKRTNSIYKEVPSPYLKDCLRQINHYRKKHGSLPLRWAPDLQVHAQNWANHLVQHNTVESNLDNLNKLRHGQTVSYSSSAKPRCRTYPPSGDCFACRTTVDKWYNESRYYNYKTGYSKDGTKQVLHFTQLVWSDTVKVGIATAVSPWYGVITVARFYPRGNIGFVDDYVANVSPYGTQVDDDVFTNNGDNRGAGPPDNCRRRQPRARVCKDKYPATICEFWKNYPGYCDYNRKYMLVYCKFTCNLCDQPLETEEERKQNMVWKVGEWEKCNGDFAERVVQCLHTHHNYVYEVKQHECVKILGRKPAHYKACAL